MQSQDCHPAGMGSQKIRTEKEALGTTKNLMVMVAAAAIFTVGAWGADRLTDAGGVAIYCVLQIWVAKYAKRTGTQVNYEPA